MQPYSKLDRTYKFLVVLALVIASLILTKDIVMPLVFAGLFSAVLLPIEQALERKLGRIFSISIVLVSALVLTALVIWFIVSQLSSLTASLPSLEERFSSSVNDLSASLHERFNIGIDEQTQLLKAGARNLSAYVGELLLSTSYLAYFFVQVPIYIFLFLFYRERFKEFLLAVVPGSDLKWKDEIQRMVRSYIAGLALVVLIAGTLNSIGLLLLGIDQAIFFGFLSGALTMIPYVGIAIGALLPTILALITKDSAWYAVGVIAVHAVVQFLEGNLITPKVTGSRISINAMAAILALLIGGKIWGIAGMILAVPAVGILKIVLSYSRELKPLVILLGDTALPDREEKEENGEEKFDPENLS